MTLLDTIRAMDPVAVLRLTEVHQSTLSDWECCPRLWAGKRIEKLPDRSYYGDIGTACHRAAEQITRHGMIATAREPYLVAREELLAAALDMPLSGPQFQEASEIMERVTGPDSRIWLKPLPGWKYAPEVTLRFDADWQPTTDPVGAYGMTLDRLQVNEEKGFLEVWDFKSGFKFESEDSVAVRPQAQAYSLGALQVYPGVPSVRFRMVMLRHGYSTAHDFVRDDSSWQIKIKDRFWIARQQITAALKTGEFPEVVGKWCRWCPRRHVCETREGMRAAGAVIELPRQELARRARAYGAIADEYSEALRAEVEANGPVELATGRWYGAREEKRTTLAHDRVTTLERLRNLGMQSGAEAAIFAPTDAAMPGLVREAIKTVFPVRKMAKLYEAELLAPAVGVKFREYEE